MGKYFSDVVDQALEDIYYCYDTERAARSFEALKAAADTGDGDASYIYSRCLSGPQYSWTYHPFPEDDDGVVRYVRQSIMQGSAMGVLGAMRCGELTPELEASMPFVSLKHAWNIVKEKADAGCLFCQHMIGNTYFWLDIVRIEEKDRNSFPTQEEWVRYLRESTLACLPWFEKAFNGGMGFAVKNIYSLYKNGEENLIAPQPEKAEAVAKKAAERGFPDWMETYGSTLLKKEGREREGLALCKGAAEKGQLSAWYYVGLAYEEGKFVTKDLPYALSCYEKGLSAPRPIGCSNRAGNLYFLGEGGVPQDYARAVQLFERAQSFGNKWSSDLLGTCYLFGFGCPKDPLHAREIFETAGWSNDRINYGLGVIYTEGLGVPVDMKKGVEYFQKAKNYAPAQEAMLKFKKNLFGKWVRR